MFLALKLKHEERTIIVNTDQIVCVLPEYDNRGCYVTLSANASSSALGYSVNTPFETIAGKLGATMI